MKVTHSLVLVALAILEMDSEGDGRIWGYALYRLSGVRSGVLYPQLDRMATEGWLESHWEAPDEAMKRPPRRYYRLTETGRIKLGAMARQAQREQRFASVRLNGANWSPA